MELRDSAGTRNALTEYAEAGAQLDDRKACVRALRKHVCAVLIGEKYTATTMRMKAFGTSGGVGSNIFHP